MSEAAGSGAAMRSLPARMYGAAVLRAHVCGEVATDPRATAQAGAVVVVVSLIAAIPDYGLGWPAMLAAAAASMLHWPLSAAIAWLVGGRLFGGSAAWRELLRTLGFARSPGVLLLLDPMVGGVGLIVHAWTLAAGVVAIRAPMGFGFWRALLTAVAGIVPYWLLLALWLH